MHTRTHAHTPTHPHIRTHTLTHTLTRLAMVPPGRTQPSITAPGRTRNIGPHACVRGLHCRGAARAVAVHGTGHAERL